MRTREEWTNGKRYRPGSTIAVRLPGPEKKNTKIMYVNQHFENRLKTRKWCVRRRSLHGGTGKGQNQMRTTDLTIWHFFLPHSHSVAVPWYAVARSNALILIYSQTMVAYQPAASRIFNVFHSVPVDRRDEYTWRWPPFTHSQHKTHTHTFPSPTTMSIEKHNYFSLYVK